MNINQKTMPDNDLVDMRLKIATLYQTGRIYMGLTRQRENGPQLLEQPFFQP
jgi:hypothetical protein